MLDASTKYCEQLLNVSIEPFNVVSSLAFVFFAFLALYKFRKESSIKKFTLSFLLALVGLGSVWWHVGHTAGGDMADTLFIIVFASAIGILLLYKLLESTLKVILTFVPLLVFTLSAEQLPHLNGSMPYVVLLGGLMAFGFLFVKKFPESKAQIIISVCTFGLAILFRSFDMELCSQVVIGTHFLWHIFVALLGYQLVLLVMNKYSKTSMI